MVEFSRLKRQSFKGIVDVVYGGEKPPPVQAAEQPPKKQATQLKENKRKANDGPEPSETKPLPKSQTKKAKKAKMKST